ncbi:MAG TPA: CBS domain-containing protein [Kofleriaceae bacterium]
MGIKVEDVMTPDPLCMPPTATVGEAYALMREHGFRHVPICEGDLLLGVFSMTDVGHLGARVPEIMQTPLHEVMSKNLVTVKPAESVASAAATMASKKINCLLVVVDRKLAGIVTTYDLLDALAQLVRSDG